MIFKIAVGAYPKRRIYKHIKYNMYVNLLKKDPPNCDLKGDGGVFTTW